MIYISPKACQYLVSTRINRIETETVFPCPPFLLFVLCLLSRSSWNLCSNRSWSNYYYHYHLSRTGSSATATLPVHAGENLGVTKYERWERRQGSIVAPMATKPTLPDEMCLPNTGKPA